MAAGAILSELHADDDFLPLSRAVSEFADRELVPYLSQLGGEEFPARLFPLAGNNGFLGTTIPAEYGGQGGTLEGFLSILEGLAACDGSLALTLAAHESLAATHILLGGDDDQKQKYLPELTAGKKIGAWCVMESQAGSNIFSDMRTKLIRTGEIWKLIGEKTFITNGCHADLLVVLARTVSADGKDLGMTACVVERSGNGDRISPTPVHNMTGMYRSDMAALKFDEVPVTDGAILGAVGSGDKAACHVLLRGRIGMGALALGLARDSLERAVAYAKGCKVAGGLLLDQSLTRAKLSRMEGNLWVAWQAVRSAAQCVDAAKPCKVQACMAKVFATETALRITDEAIQILGGYGHMRDYKVDQNYRDARLLTLGEGASEILRLAITRNLMDKSSADVRDVLSPLERQADAAGPYRGSMSDLWGPSWRSLQLADEAVHLVREQVEQHCQPADSTSAWQLRAVGFADLATRLWVSIQAVLTGAKLVNRGSASQKQMKLIKNFVVNSAIEICHQASELLRTVGLTDARLLTNYVEALQIGATANSSWPVALTGERP